ncbi:MAG: TIGR00153 family protein [Magnetococcales bacterium]|nr:TIGR00153 family protein [Magnetococcales bacterium]
MPTSNPFISLFGRSPFKPLQQHMRTVTECAALVPALLQALIDGDAQGMEAVAQSILTLEEKADEIKNSMRAHLPKSLFMPVDRRDLLEVLSLQDTIADSAQEAAELLRLRPMPVPEAMAQPLLAFARQCVEACRQAEMAIEELDELVEMGFSGRELARVMAMVDQLAETERQADVMRNELFRALFTHEEVLGAVSVLFLHRLIEWIGKLADGAEKVGDRLRLLLAR